MPPAPPKNPRMENVFVAVGAVTGIYVFGPSSGLGAFGSALVGGAVGCFVNNMINKRGEGYIDQPIEPFLKAVPAGVGSVIGWAVSDNGQRGAMIGAVVVPLVAGFLGLDGILAY